jgi:hypothetical protein|tara:strand:- start:736 stop:954 length:219 start_codon:yes stop_codon:yes gene_type:complete
MNTNRITLWIAELDGFGGGTVSRINLSLQEVCNQFNKPGADKYSKYFTTKEFAEDYLAEAGYLDDGFDYWTK